MGREKGGSCDAAVVVTVTVTGVAPVGVTDDGLIVQLAFELDARPLQLSDTAWLRPPEGVKVRL